MPPFFQGLVTPLTTAFATAALAVIGEGVSDYLTRQRENRSIASALAGEMGAYIENLRPEQAPGLFRAIAEVPREARLAALQAYPALPSSHPVFDKLADRIGFLPPDVAFAVSRFYNIVTGLRLLLSSMSSRGFLEANDRTHAAILQEIADTIQQEARPARELVKRLQKLAR